MEATSEAQIQTILKYPYSSKNEGVVEDIPGSVAFAWWGR